MDSTRVERTNNCDAPCNVPSWPSATDTLLTRTASARFDVVGRDSVRFIPGVVNTGITKGPVVVAYDALGRVVRRWLHGTAQPVDSFRFDVAGNLRFHRTRRAHTFETQYDSRNRVVTRIIPTVGTFTHSYGGPNDELTAITAAAGFADSVGGSNVNVSWVYNQSGQLRSETVQGTRTTTYFYDTYFRDSVFTDPLGTWQVRYDQNRGVADSLLTPFGDWVTYAIDSRGRVNGPTVDGTGQDLLRSQTWRINGGLTRIQNTQGYVVGDFLQGALEPGDSLAPTWTEKQGSGGPTNTMADSVTYDGWQRVAGVVYLLNGSPVQTETFTYNQGGNLFAGQGEVYDKSLNRLTGNNSCIFSYDAGGNMTSKTCGSWTYVSDALDRIVKATNTAGLSATYTYDALGQRIAKKVNGAITRFVWRSGHVSFETNGSGTIQRSYTWGISTDDLVAIHDHSGNAHYYVVQDKLRSLRGLVDRNGTWKASWRYRAYGAQLATSGSIGFTMRFRWAGAQYDEETGFYFLRSRYYDPAIGRFVQEDPIGYAGGANLYAYGGDPTSGRDPDGLMMNYDQYYIPTPPSLKSEPIEWDWIGGGWDLLLSQERVAAYERYAKAFDRQSKHGVFGLGQRWDSQTRKLSYTEFGKLMLGLPQLGAGLREQMVFTVNFIDGLAGAGRIAVNNQYVGSEYIARADAPRIVLWLNADLLMGSSIVSLAFALAHEAGHFNLYYEGSRQLWRDECNADVFAARATGLWGLITEC